MHQSIKKEVPDADNEDKSLLRKRKSSDFNHEIPEKRENGANIQDHDDEVLIRETQAALKSLSGSWSKTDKSFFKNSSDCAQDQNSFQNLFDTKMSRIQANKEAAWEKEVELHYKKNYDGRSKNLNERTSSKERAQMELEIKRGSAFKPLDSRKSGYSFDVLSYSNPEMNKAGNDDYSLAESKQYTILQPAKERSALGSVIDKILTINSTNSLDQDQVSSSTIDSLNFNKLQMLPGNKGN